MKKRDARPLRFAVIFWVWTLFGLVFTAQSYLGRNYLGAEVSWADAALRWMPCGYAWAVLTPPVLWLNRRYPIGWKNWRRTLMVHVPASLLFAVLSMALYLIAVQLVQWDKPVITVDACKNLLVGGLHLDLLIYGVVAVASSYREREISASKLQAELAEAQLAALKAQLQPHFLFNALNTIAVLMEEDTKTARRMLVRLSDLLRIILHKGAANEVSLKEEVELLQSYLEIEQMRFHDRLKVQLAIDANALDARVPDLVLQPLVENAIKYGVVRSGGGQIEIRAERERGNLLLEVRDDGPGLRHGAGSGAGVGLKNTRARLERLYGDDHLFEMRNETGGGLVVRLTIPFQHYYEEDTSNHRRR